MSLDNFSTALDSLIAPARNCFSIIPHDVTALVEVPKAIYVGSGGDIVVRAIDSNQDVVFANVASGSILDVRAAAIRATGTTANDLVGLA